MPNSQLDSFRVEKDLKCVLEKFDKPSHDRHVQVQELKIMILRLENLCQNIFHPKNVLNELKSSLQTFLIFIFFHSII